MRQALSIALPLRDFMVAPTISGLSARVDQILGESRATTKLDEVVLWASSARPFWFDRRQRGNRAVTVSDLLAELRSRDIHVWADGDQVKVNALAGALTQELREQLRLRKSEILRLLRAPAELIVFPAAAVVPGPDRDGQYHLLDAVGCADRGSIAY